MEQGQCFWMETKRKYSVASSNFLTSQIGNKTNNLISSYGDSSWEEQAFLEDASGSLGGCVWPPRSYTCSFCRREFRSAQALGGHMNVHRRDRARLKQPNPSCSPQNDEILYHDDLQKKPSSSRTDFESFGNNYLYPSSYSKTTTNNPDFLASSTSKGLDLLASTSVHGNLLREENFIPFSNSSSILYHKISPVNSSESWPRLNGDHRLCSNNSSKLLFHPEKDGIVHEKVSKRVDSRFRGKGDNKDDGDDDDDIDVAMRLNLVVCRAHTPLKFETKEEDMNNFKKRKIDAPPSILFLPKSSSKVFEFCPSSIEELDLELKLGM